MSTKEHWPLFKKVFDIPDPGDKGRAKNLKWMNRINELRRIPAHPTKERNFTLDDFAYLDWLHEELFARIG